MSYEISASTLSGYNPNASSADMMMSQTAFEVKPKRLPIGVVIFFILS
jgi:hypothetical protein